jgi:hypothetical protein
VSARPPGRIDVLPSPPGGFCASADGALAVQLGWYVAGGASLQAASNNKSQRMARRIALPLTTVNE